ncbi:MAG: hypothetical protein RR394_07680 [Oscillospiraceae bacterium]
MKRIFAVLLAISIILCAGGCSTGKISDASASQSQRLVVFKAGGKNVGAYELNVNLSKPKLSLNTKALYEIPDSSRLEISRIFPQYMSADALILREAPVSTEFSADRISKDASTLYFEQYTLKFDDKNFSFEIYKDSKSLYGDISLIENDKKLMPTSFFIDKDGKIALLCMTSASLIDTEMVSVLYAKDGESYSPEKICKYPTIWEDYELSKANCPNYMSTNTNVSASPATASFLYNEKAKLIAISPYDGSVKCVLKEKNITSDMPNLDTHRESYEFFNGFEYQAGYYIASFPAYNALAGTYAAFYNDKGEYAGCVLCGGDGITLFDKNNEKLDKIDGAFVPQIYLPS